MADLTIRFTHQLPLQVVRERLRALLPELRRALQNGDPKETPEISFGENSGSFKRTGLGPLIGKRTWGGLIGISANPNLIDGGNLVVPFFRFFTGSNEVEDKSSIWLPQQYSQHKWQKNSMIFSCHIVLLRLCFSGVSKQKKKKISKQLLRLEPSLSSSELMRLFKKMYIISISPMSSSMNNTDSVSSSERDSLNTSVNE